MGNSSRWESERNIKDLLNKNSTITVWTDDDVSPASFLHSHKKNIMLQWNNLCTTSTVGTGEYLIVVIHQDESVLIIRE